MRALAGLVLALSAAAQGRRFTPEDWKAWREIRDPQITPDGTQAVYVEQGRIWLVSTDGKSRRQLTTGDSPRWSTDGARIAFLREGSVFVRAIDGNEDRRLAPTEGTPLALAWQPEGEKIAITASVSEPLPKIEWAPLALRPQLRTNHRRLFVDQRQAPLDGMDLVGEPAWMPDGRSLLVALARPFEDPAIYSLRLADSALRRITNHPGPDFHPVPSPDGSRIAWLAREPATGSYAAAKLWVANPDGSRARSLAGALDRDPVDPQWSSDSRTVYFQADNQGASYIYAARNDGSIRQVTTARQRLHGFVLADNGRALTVRSPEELITFPVDRGGEPVVLAAPNRELLENREAGTVAAMPYQAGTRTIDAWLTKPPGFDSAKKYPLLLDIDDPPRMCGPEFRLRSQIFAAAGVVVLCANPRGTAGYGEVFGNLLQTGSPADPFGDLMAGLDAAIAKGFVDGSRVSIVGGLLAAWASGHADRFHAAVVRGPEKASYSGEWKTPTLVIAGANDVAAQELYGTLRSRKVDSALIRIGNDAVLEMQATLGWITK